MQSISSPPARSSRLLVVELWGVGDVALAIPFLRAASRHAAVTLVAKPHAAPLVRSFCPAVELLPFTAPWTAFTRKYEFHRWPWLTLNGLLAGLRSRRFAAAVSARPDPRDHLLLALSGADLRAGFSRAGSRVLLTDVLPRPAPRHRAQDWEVLAQHFGWQIDAPVLRAAPPRHVVMHVGAGHPVREWPRERFERVATTLREAGWPVTVLDNSLRDLDRLREILAGASHFIGNDSGPGHLAALLGVPTFTIFGPQLPELFAPVHPQAAWIEGAPCHYKPCFDACRFATPHCVTEVGTETVTARVLAWLGR